MLNSVEKNIIASVVVPCRNEEKYIKKCLESVLAGTFPRENMEIIVVDGMSEDRTESIVKELAAKDERIKLLKNPELNVSQAMNRGIEAARGKYIVRVDAHTEYAPDYVEKCVRALERTGAANVGGPMRVRANTLFQEAVGIATSSVFGVGNAHFHFEDREGPVDTVYLGAFRKDIFEKVGYFDPVFVRNQDDEMNLRINLAGEKVILCRDIVSYYVPRADLPSLIRQYYEYGYYKPLIMKKHGRPASARHLIPLIFLLTIIVWLISRIFSSAPIFKKIAYVISIFSLVPYLVLLSFFSAFNSKKNPALFLLLLAVYPSIHLSYAAGWLAGLLKWFCLSENSPVLPSSGMSRV